MAKQGVYGIASLKLQAAVANGFPTSWTTGSSSSVFKMKAIVKDSFSFNDSEATETDIEVEDMDNFYVSLPSSLATKGFTVQTYDMGEDTFKYLAGYEAGSGANSGYFVEKPNTSIGNQAVQIITRALDDFPSKTFEWANMDVKVTRAGSIGKSGFPNFNITFKQMALLNSSGVEIPGARWKLTS